MEELNIFIKRTVALLCFLLICSGPLLAEDTKFFPAFSYRQKAIWGSDYFFSPEMRFENQARDLYYYHVRSGFLFHPTQWLDLGLFYRFVNEKELSGSWDADNRFEVEISPKIVFRFIPIERILPRREEGVTGEGVVQRIGSGVLKVLEIIPKVEFEFWDLDLRDLSKVHVVSRMRPRFSWEYGFGTVYTGDEVFYSLKYSETFRNWATVGFIRALNGLSLDLYYTYELERSWFGSSVWEKSHVFGTRLIWNRK